MALMANTEIKIGTVIETGITIEMEIGIGNESDAVQLVDREVLSTDTARVPFRTS